MDRWPDADWTLVRPFPFAAARGAFAGLTAVEGSIDLVYYLRPEDRALVAVVKFGPRAEGAPGLVHGGMILTVLDEALGAACWISARPSLTVRLTTDFRLSVPLGSRLLVETRVTAERHRLVFASAALLGADGTLYAEAEGRLLRLNDDAQRRLLGQSIRRTNRASKTAPEELK